MRICNAAAGDFPVEEIQAADEVWIFFECTRNAVVRDEFDVAVGHVCESLRRGARECGGHVCDAIMRHVLLDENRIVMRGGARSFRAAALIDRDVHEDAALLHHAHHLAIDQLRRARAGHEHGADEQIHFGEHFEDVRAVRVERVRGVQGDVEEPHALHVHVEDRHVRAEALRHARGVHARGAAADDDHFSRQHAGHPAEQHAATAEMFLEKISTHEHAHTSGDFTHRFEQREAAVYLDGLVRDAGDFCGEQRLGERLARGEVKIGENDLAWAQQRPFGLERLLHFHDQFRSRKDLAVLRDDLRTGSGVLFVWKAGARAGICLDEDFVPAPDELVGGAREECDAIFLRFDFLGDADVHARSVARAIRRDNLNVGC